MAWKFKQNRTVGVVTCTKVESRQHWTNRNTKTGKWEEGKSPEGYGDGRPDDWMFLRCECGTEFEMWDSDVIPGDEEDWQKVDCGCGAASRWVPPQRVESRGRPALSWARRRVAQNFSLAPETAERIERVAERERIPYSRALDRLVEAGYPALYPRRTSFSNTSLNAAPVGLSEMDGDE